MNKRIRKKKAKQQLIRAISGLVEAAEEMQREQERRDNTGRYFLYQVYRSCPGTAVRHYACLHTTF